MNRNMFKNKTTQMLILILSISVISCKSSKESDASWLALLPFLGSEAVADGQNFEMTFLALPDDARAKSSKSPTAARMTSGWSLVLNLYDADEAAIDCEVAGNGASDCSDEAWKIGSSSMVENSQAQDTFMFMVRNKYAHFYSAAILDADGVERYRSEDMQVVDNDEGAVVQLGITVYASGRISITCAVLEKSIDFDMPLSDVLNGELTGKTLDAELVCGLPSVTNLDASPARGFPVDMAATHNAGTGKIDIDAVSLGISGYDFYAGGKCRLSIVSYDGDTEELKGQTIFTIDANNTQTVEGIHFDFTAQAVIGTVEVSDDGIYDLVIGYKNLRDDLAAFLRDLHGGDLNAAKNSVSYKLQVTGTSDGSTYDSGLVDLTEEGDNLVASNLTAEVGDTLKIDLYVYRDNDEDGTAEQWLQGSVAGIILRTGNNVLNETIVVKFDKLIEIGVSRVKGYVAITVRNGSNVLVPGATVTLTHRGQNVTETGTTGLAGATSGLEGRVIFVGSNGFSKMRAGTYDMTITKGSSSATSSFTMNEGSFITPIVTLQ